LRYTTETVKIINISNFMRFFGISENSRLIYHHISYFAYFLTNNKYLNLLNIAQNVI